MAGVAIVVAPIVVTPIIDALIIAPWDVGIVTVGRTFCIAAAMRIATSPITRTAVDIATAGDRAVRAAAAFTERVYGRGAGLGIVTSSRARRLSQLPS